MIFKTFIDTNSPALGANAFQARVFVSLAIDSAEDYLVSLRLWDLTPVQESDLCAEAKRDLAAWVADSLEQYADYMDDMALLASDMSESQVRYRRWFGRNAQ